MASDDLTDVSSILINNYCSVVSFAILYYDYAITVTDEVERFWTLRRISWASVFFFLNRYLSVLGHVPVIAEVFLVSSQDVGVKQRICQQLQTYHQYFAVVVQIIVGIMLIMRTYALYGRKIWVLVFLVGIAAAVIATGCWAILTQTGSNLPPDPGKLPGCVEVLSEKEGVRLAIAWSGVVVFDTTVFSLTLWKALSISHTTRRGLISTLLRDGAIYYAVMTLATISNIITFFVASPPLKGVVTTFSNVISSSMLSRLMLNIRDPKLDVNSTRNLTTATSLPFVTTILDDYTINPIVREPEQGYIPELLHGENIELVERKDK